MKTVREEYEAATQNYKDVKSYFELTRLQLQALAKDLESAEERYVRASHNLATAQNLDEALGIEVLTENV